jgi:hypothetical protein
VFKDIKNAGFQHFYGMNVDAVSLQGKDKST